MKKEIESILKSADRLRGAQEWKTDKNKKLILAFMRRESSILLRRAWRFWWRLRFGRGGV